MSQINPFTGSVVQAPYVQRSQAADKDRQLRRADDLAKNSALQGDTLDHQVESSEAIQPVHDETPRRQTQKRKKKQQPAQKDDEPHIDVTA